MVAKYISTSGSKFFIVQQEGGEKQSKKKKAKYDESARRSNKEVAKCGRTIIMTIEKWKVHKNTDSKFYHARTGIEDFDTCKYCNWKPCEWHDCIM